MLLFRLESLLGNLQRLTLLPWRCYITRARGVSLLAHYSANVASTSELFEIVLEAKVGANYSRNFFLFFHNVYIHLQVYCAVFFFSTSQILYTIIQKTKYKLYTCYCVSLIKKSCPNYARMTWNIHFSLSAAGSLMRLRLLTGTGHFF